MHCVRPIAMEKYPVYVQNTREYTLIDTENFGQVVQMEIGALLVGKYRTAGIRAMCGVEQKKDISSLEGLRLLF